LQGRSDVLNVCHGLKCVRIVSPNVKTREGTLLLFVILRGQLVDRGQLVGIARRRRAPRSPEHLGCLLVVVVCVEKCGMSLMSITCRGCGGGARWSCSGTMGPAACRRRASRRPHPSRRSCRGMSWKPAPESTTSRARRSPCTCRRVLIYPCSRWVTNGSQGVGTHRIR